MSKKFTAKNWDVYQGDCIKVMQTDLAGRKFDFIFADPPFNIGHKYDGYEDAISHKEYKDFTIQWIRNCFLLLRQGGIFCIHVPDAVAEYVLHLLYGGMFDGMPIERKDWVIWHYRFGQNGRTKFVNSKVHCLVYTRGRNMKTTFNGNDVLVDSDRAAMGDKRTATSATPGKRVPLDVFGIPSDGPYWGRVTGSHSNKERRGNHPNQLPEKYLERLIRAYSNPGDDCFDPFGGTGTTATVGSTLGRKGATCDQSLNYVHDIVERIETGAILVHV